MTKNINDVKIIWKVFRGAVDYPPAKFTCGYTANGIEIFTIIRPTNYGREPYKYELRCHLVGLTCYKCNSANHAALVAKDILKRFIQSCLA